MKKLFILLVAAISFNFASAQSIQNEFYGFKLGESYPHDSIKAVIAEKLDGHIVSLGKAESSLSSTVSTTDVSFEGIEWDNMTLSVSEGSTLFFQIQYSNKFNTASEAHEFLDSICGTLSAKYGNPENSDDAVRFYVPWSTDSNGTDMYVSYSESQTSPKYYSILLTFASIETFEKILTEKYK